MPSATPENAPEKNLPVLLWLVLPVALIVIQVILEILVPNQYMPAMHSEGGPHETVQFVIIVMATLLAAWLAVRVKGAGLKLWLVAAALGCFYIAGEEVSWGQWIVGWTTPEFWSGINDQNETNLHNTSSWLDQKPRLLLFIGIVFAGIIIPIFRRKKPEWVPAKFKDLLPGDLLCVTALGVLVPYAIQKIAEQFAPGGLFVRVSEVQEIYMYYFILLYLIDFRNRVFSQD